MKTLSLAAISLACLAAISCSRSTGSNDSTTAENITFCASDSADIWQPLEASAQIGDVYKFGSVEASKFSEHFTTDSVDVFIDYNVTLLELNPDITKQLFTLTHDKLRKLEFLAKADTVAPYTAADIDPSRHTQAEILKTMLAWTRRGFEAHKDTIYRIGSDVGDRLVYNARFDIYPVWMDEDYVTYAVRGVCFIGGAHDDESNSLLTFNRMTGNLLTVKDIVSPENDRELHRLVALHMAGHNDYGEVKDVEEYLDKLNEFVETFPSEDGAIFVADMNKITTGNFPLTDPAITAQGLVFIYPRYKMAPASSGTPQVVLPWQEVAPLLKAPFNKIK